MRRLDPDLPVTELTPLSDLVSGSMASAELAVSLLGVFACAAILLAAAGIYGVMAYAVTQRRMEFGIRVALGASPRDLIGLVARQGVLLTAAGIGLGSIGAWLSSSLLRDMVYGVRATDPVVFTGTAAVLALISLAACVVPALRAMRVDPVRALRAGPARSPRARNSPRSRPAAGPRALACNPATSSPRSAIRPWNPLTL